MTTTELTLSSAAAQRLQALGHSEGKPIMLRIAVEGGGCSGFQYQLDLVDEAQPDDLRIERDGVAALIDRRRAKDRPEWAQGLADDQASPLEGT